MIDDFFIMYQTESDDPGCACHGLVQIRDGDQSRTFLLLFALRQDRGVPALAVAIALAWCVARPAYRHVIEKPRYTASGMRRVNGLYAQNPTYTADKRLYG